MMRQRGFTLIEMMIALAIGAVFIVPLYIITQGMSSQAAAQRMDVESMARARIGLNELMVDLGRAGLTTSPFPNDDIESRVRTADSQRALHRRAVVHLNRARAGFDSMLLIGNFIGSKTYRGRADGTRPNEIVFPAGNETLDNEEECTRQFNASYAYAHLRGPVPGTVDVDITDTEYIAGRCRITVDLTGVPEEFLRGGDSVIWVAANQAALYRVEQVEPVIGGCKVPHNELVRYFVEFDGSFAGSCTTAQPPTSTSTLYGDTSAEVDWTRQVLVPFVEDFQVWFRPGTAINGMNGLPILQPHFTRVSELFSNNAEFVRADADHYVPQNLGGNIVADNLSCAASSLINPQHVRSAVVRVAVRSERTDRNMDWRSFGTPFDINAGRLARLTIQPHTPSDGSCPEKTGAAYKLKTLTTEVPMPNLAARTNMLF